MIEIDRQPLNETSMILLVEGEIDLSTSPALREAVLEVFAEDSRRVLISLRGVNHIDSSGMATLVEGLQRAHRTGGRLVLTELDEHVRDLFRMTHLDEVFEIAPTREEGVARLAQAGAS